MIVSSPIERALDTAKVVREVARVEAPIEIDKDLAEYDFGELSGTPTGRTSKEVFDTRGAENPVSFVKRCKRAVLRYAGRGEGNTLLVTHGGVMRAVRSIELGLPAEKHRDQRISANAEVEVVDIDAIIRNKE